MLGQLCACVESTLPAVGMINRRGYSCQQKLKYCSPCQTIQSILKPVFCQIGQICCIYNSLRCLGLEIWRYLCHLFSFLFLLSSCFHLNGIVEDVSITVFLCFYHLMLLRGVDATRLSSSDSHIHSNCTTSY